MGHPPGVRLSSPGFDADARRRADERYAEAERSLEPFYERRRRRGPPVLIATMLSLILAVGVVVAVDLRRLQTPQGTSQTWTGAAVFGACAVYEKLSVPAPDAAPDSRDKDERCADLDRETAPNRQAGSEISIDVGRVEQTGRTARVDVTVRRPAGAEQATLELRRRGGGWVVVRTSETCAVIGCA